MTQLAASELLVRSEPRGSRRRFIGHFLEMIVVMSLGMAVLGAAFGALHDLLFGGDYAGAWRDHVALAAFGMAFNMTVPMVLWMRYRGHSWERGGEMAVAMNLPVLPLLVVNAFGALSEGGVLCWQMTLMLPAMLGVMLYRKDEYTAPHRRHVPLLRRLRWSRVFG